MTIFSLNKSYFFGFQVTRLEGQVTRYKSAAENAEKVEDDLKAEKRKLQREVEFSDTAEMTAVMSISIWTVMHYLFIFCLCTPQ